MNVDDRLAILDQIARDSYAWDGRDADAYAALFTADGVFEVFAAAREEPSTPAAGAPRTAARLAATDPALPIR